MFEKQVHLLTSAQDNFTDQVFYYFGTVINTIDPIDAKRIQVRIKGVDDKIIDSKLPWCASFLPLNFITNPKLGEMVKVFIPNSRDIMNKREWMGPIFSSFRTLGYESANTALVTQDISSQTPDKSINKIPDANGAYVDDEAIAFQGRNNADFIFKDQEVLIRAGKFVSGNNIKTNIKNPAYIQLKLSSDGSQSTTMLSGDKICLISYGGSKQFKAIIDDTTMQNIINNALSAAYAEPIVEFLKLIQNFVANHIHPQNLPANKGFGKIPEIIKYDLNKIVAKNIKIN